jgi:uncharacterized protein with NRDE domain
MCTVVIFRRPDHEWPVIIGANRDEMRARPWKPPSRHWPDRPHVLAGLDSLAGGTWLGRNDDGVVAAVMNRERSLGPSPGKRSRGELPLEALDHADATAAAMALAALNPDAYRPFNMLIADNRDAYWICNTSSAERIELEKLQPGWSMLTSYRLNDPKCPRTAANLPRFERAPIPEPDSNDWTAWQMLLASEPQDASADSRSALCVVTDTGFGTICSTLIALPSIAKMEQIDDRRGHFLFAAGPPNEAPFESFSE